MSSHKRKPPRVIFVKSAQTLSDNEVENRTKELTAAETITVHTEARSQSYKNGLEAAQSEAEVMNNSEAAQSGAEEIDSSDVARPGAEVMDKSKTTQSEAEKIDSSKAAQSVAEVMDNRKAAQSGAEVMDNSDAAQSGAEVMDNRKATQSGAEVMDNRKAAQSGAEVMDNRKAAQSGAEVMDNRKAAQSGAKVMDSSKTAQSGAEVMDNRKAAQSGTEVIDNSKAAQSGAEVMDSSKTAQSGAEVMDSSKTAQSGAGEINFDVAAQPGAEKINNGEVIKRKSNLLESDNTNVADSESLEILTLLEEINIEVEDNPGPNNRVMWQDDCNDDDSYQMSLASHMPEIGKAHRRGKATTGIRMLQEISQERKMDIGIKERTKKSVMYRWFKQPWKTKVKKVKPEKTTNEKKKEKGTSKLNLIRRPKKTRVRAFKEDTKTSEENNKENGPTKLDRIRNFIRQSIFRLQNTFSCRQI